MRLREACLQRLPIDKSVPSALELGESCMISAQNCSDDVGVHRAIQSFEVLCNIDEEVCAV